ncbi:hypothetical protein [Paludisphaera soli]|uniref:hypothetical protein n=1 Tax=Paludisphaera soli TaxID=2712865 RepID=UPI0013ECB379|nr:hypothetical protein [Paludisphaera soli]
MTRTLLRSVVAVSLVVAWATTTEACHKRRARAAVACVGAPQGDAGYAAPASAQSGYYGSPQGYAAPAAYSDGGYPAGAYGGYPAGAYGGYPAGAAAGYPAGAYGGYPAGAAAGYPAGAYGGYPAGATGGYDFGRPGYNPGGLGGPASGLGVRPGMGLGGFGPGR